MNEELRDELNYIFDEMSDEDSLSAWNAYCYAINDEDGMIYEMNEIDQVLGSWTPYEILSCTLNRFDISDYYFFANREGDEICSFTDFLSPTSSFDRDAMINYIVETHDDLGNDDIAEAIYQIVGEE